MIIIIITDTPNLQRKNRSEEPENRYFPKLYTYTLGMESSLTSDPDLLQHGYHTLFIFGMVALNRGCLGFFSKLMQTVGSCLLLGSCAIHGWHLINELSWLFIFLEQQRDWVGSLCQMENTSCVPHSLSVVIFELNFRLANG